MSDVAKQVHCADVMQLLAATRANGTVVWYGWLAGPVQHIKIPDFFTKTWGTFPCSSDPQASGSSRTAPVSDPCLMLYQPLEYANLMLHGVAQADQLHHLHLVRPPAAG